MKKKQYFNNFPEDASGPTGFPPQSKTSSYRHLCIMVCAQFETGQSSYIATWWAYFKVLAKAGEPVLAT